MSRKTTMTNNERRAKSAEKCLRTFPDFKYDKRLCLVDLLANLRHWSEKNGINFDEADSVAAGHFRVERADENE